MTEWTESARQELARYVERVASSAVWGEGDPVEVADDIRRHVDQEVAAAGLDVVTEADVKRILTAMGLPESGVDAPAVAGEAPPRPPADMPICRLRNTVLIALFGVALPVVTIVFESLSGLCAKLFFDPLPTPWHVLLFAIIPLANFLTLLSAGGAKPRYWRVLGWINGAAVGVAICYTLAFLPILPFAIVGVLALGLGLLGLAPVLGLVSSLQCRRYIRAASAEVTEREPRGFWPGMGLAVAALMLLMVQMVLTHMAMGMAASDSPETSARGVRWLRAVGSEREMLDACYQSWSQDEYHPATMTVLNYEAIGPEEVRAIYYRVTGSAFNAPDYVGPRRRWWRGSWGSDIDTEQGGEAVGRRSKDLTLSSSCIDGKVDADAATAYIEWTLEFLNASASQQEARAQVLLPAGGVVSRVSLWINGEQCEAAFAARGKAQAAYSEVVRAKRDPLLVTATARDRVMIQCFPVPPQGRMKIRIGISAPLGLLSAGDAFVRPPCFVERNFNLGEHTRHALWFTATRPLWADGDLLRAEDPAKGSYALRGELSNPDLSSAGAIVRARRPGKITQVYSHDPARRETFVVCQTLGQRGVRSAGRIVYVVDGSAAMKPLLSEVADAVARTPAGVRFAVIFADDDPGSVQAVSLETNAPGRSQAAARHLRDHDCQGGRDNVPALERAWDLAAGEGGIIVWVHGPQAVLLRSPHALRQRWDRRANGPLLYEIQVAPGPDRVLEALHGLTEVRSANRLMNPVADLDRLLAELTGAKRPWTVTRKRMPRDEFQTKGWTREDDGHVARLWAHGEVLRKSALGKASETAEAVEMACTYRLVTPVSAAVVLESRAQYLAAGIEPPGPEADDGTNVPEPGTWLMMILSTGAVAWAVRRRRRAAYEAARADSTS